MYKGRYDLPFEEFYSFATLSNSRGHSLKLLRGKFHLNRRGSAFAVRVVAAWNKIPQYVSMHHTSLLFSRDSIGAGKLFSVCYSCHFAHNCCNLCYLAYKMFFQRILYLLCCLFINVRCMLSHQTSLTFILYISVFLYHQRISALQLIPDDGLINFPNKEALTEPRHTSMTTNTVLYCCKT